MTKLLASGPRPTWVHAGVPASIEQDQAMEAWYQEEVRSTGVSETRIEELHERNRRNPEAAAAEVFERWRKSTDFADGAPWVNDHPAEVRLLLARDELAKLDLERVKRIILLTHAPRDHARQIRNGDLGLAPGASTGHEARCELYAKLLLSSVSEGGKSLRDILEFVLWGDSDKADCAERVWDAVHTAEWSIPHLGVNTLGELIGYARPDEFPPRNGRVSKSLHALGFEGIAY